MTYLLLRQDRLAHIPGATYNVLAPYYATYKTEKVLSDDAVKHITNIEKKAAGRKHGFDNLQTVYAFDRCIGRALLGVPEDRQRFMLDIREFLRGNLYLTQAQVSGLDKWLRRIDGYIPLDSSKFWRD